jgi:hypothetical protein
MHDDTKPGKWQEIEEALTKHESLYGRLDDDLARFSKIDPLVEEATPAEEDDKKESTVESPIAAT